MIRPSANQVSDFLDASLPDETIIQDAVSLLQECSENGVITLEVDDGVINAPLNAELTILQKAFFKEYTSYRFGTYKVVIALGSLRIEENGLPSAQYGFLTFYYNENRQVITNDFHEEVR